MTELTPQQKSDAEFWDRHINGWKKPPSKWHTYSLTGKIIYSATIVFIILAVVLAASDQAKDSEIDPLDTGVSIYDSNY